MTMSDSIAITLLREEHVANFENAVGAVERELDRELHTGRGRPGEGEIALGDVVNELATAYTGTDLGEHGEGGEE